MFGAEKQIRQVRGLQAEDDFLKAFIVEANMYMEEMEDGLLRLKAGGGDETTVSGIFRAAHSIRGIAGLFELDRIAELSHSMERLFAELSRQRIEVSPEMADVLLSAGAMLKKLVQIPAESREYDIDDQLAAVRAFLPALTGQPGESSDILATWDLWNQLTSSDKTDTADASEPPGTLSASSAVKSGTGIIPMTPKQRG